MYPSIKLGELSVIEWRVNNVQNTRHEVSFKQREKKEEISKLTTTVERQPTVDVMPQKGILHKARRKLNACRNIGSETDFC